MTPALLPAVVTGLIAFGVSLIAPWPLRPLLTRLGVIDRPNVRSSHTKATLRGMGLSMAVAVAVSVPVAMLTNAVPTNRFLALGIAAAALAIAVVGWIEDVRGLSVRERASLQFGIGLIMTAAMIANLHTSWWWVLPGAFAFAVYVNVANFMDGVNGMSGFHGLVVGLFYAYGGQAMGQVWLTVGGFVLAGAFAAFLPWNLGRGRVFMGDVGSYLLGGSIAAMAVGGFLSGIYVEYLLSPLMIYLADTGYTILRRFRAGKRWYESHREHVFQRLTDLGFSHLGVSLLVAGLSVVTGVAGAFAATATTAGALLAQLVALAAVAGYLMLPSLLLRRKSRGGA